MRFLSAALALSLLTTSGWVSTWDVLVSPAQAQTQVSNDMNWTEVYAEALEAQTELVVLQGQPLSTTLTRIEFAQWLVEFFDYVADPGQAVVITDMQPNSPDWWTAQAIVQSGVMRLFEGDAFRPEGDITKLEALAILVRVLQRPQPTPQQVENWMSLYSDANEVPEIGHPFIAMAGEAGLILNIPEPERLNPNLVLRRGEGIAMFYQTLTVRNQVSPLDPPIPQLQPTPVSAPPSGTTLTPDARPQIFAFRIMPESGIVPVGNSLVIEAQATPGGRASVDIGSLVQNLPMQEQSPGLYRATFTPGPQDMIQGPDITIRLSIGNEVTRTQQRLPQLVVGRDSPAVDSPIVSDSGRGPSAPTQAPPGTQSQGSTDPLSSAANYPEFTSIRLQPERNLQEGDILTINVWGESGAVATFDLGTLVTNQPMREIKPNLYEGTYVVGVTDQATGPTLRIMFSSNGLTTQHAEIFPFRIDGSVGTRSTIQSPPLPPANPSQLNIRSITTNAEGRTLQSDDILEVRFYGDAGGEASFRIVDVTPQITMSEILPGFYEGRVRIPSDMLAVTNSPIEVQLRKDGQQSLSTGPVVNIAP
jgi:hypothetical protein